MSQHSEQIQSHAPTNAAEALSADPVAARVLAKATRSAALAQDEVFALKQELAVAHEPERGRASLEIQALQAELVAARAALTEAGWHELDRHRTRADHFETCCNELKTSTSWRITAPLRVIGRLFRPR